MGRAPQPFLGWRAHQILVPQDRHSIVERERLPRRSVHRSGAITVCLEEHDRGRAEKVGLEEGNPTWRVRAK